MTHTRIDSGLLACVVAGGMVLSTSAAATTVAEGTVLTVESAGQFTAADVITLDGGTLDVNGFDVTLSCVGTTPSGGMIVNNGASAATLTCAGDGSYSFSGTLANGLSPLSFVHSGTGLGDFSGATLANAGFSATGGKVRFAERRTAKARLLRFAPTATRPAPSSSPHYGGSGPQITEFRLLLDGAAVEWPTGTTAYTPGDNSKSAPLAIDGVSSAASKWYSWVKFAPLIVDCGKEMEFNAYQFQTGGDADGRDPISWELSVGSVAGGVTNWVAVDARAVDVSIEARSHVPTNRLAWADAFLLNTMASSPAVPQGYAFSVSAPAVAEFGSAGEETVAGRLIRFQPTESRPATMNYPNYGTNGIQMTEFQLLRNGTAVAWPASTAAYAPGDTSGSVGKAIDGDSSAASKWYSWRHPATHPADGFIPLVVDCGEDVTFDSYRFQTGGDAIGRDPVAWELSVGTVSGGVTNWVVVDVRKNMVEGVPTARFAWTDALPANGSALRTDLAFSNLSGNGGLALTNGMFAIVGGASTFTGSFSAKEKVSLAYASAAVPAVTAADAGTAIVNDGAAAALQFAEGEWIQNGAYLDGAGALGLEILSGANLCMAGAGNGYSGATTVRSGGSVRTGAKRRAARYFRFNVTKNNANETGKHVQISKLNLVCDGQEVEWPEGTTATSELASGYAAGATANVIDGSVDTKCYWWTFSALVIALPEEVQFDGYCWYTGDDTATYKRNPASWTFQMSDDGVNWTLLDSQADKAVPTANKTLAYTCPTDAAAVYATDSMGDDSPVVLEASADCVVAGVEEMIGALSGAGKLAIAYGAMARLNAAADSVFQGTVFGAGTLVKAGGARQTISGAVDLSGAIVVEAGVLDLSGAVLTGVTNIVLKGGTLVGSATVSGDLTVTSEGGAYGASLAVSGKLTLAGAPKIRTGVVGRMATGTAFTFGSTDAASAALFRSATCVEAENDGVQRIFVVRATSNSMTWGIYPRPLVISFR